MSPAEAGLESPIRKPPNLRGHEDPIALPPQPQGSSTGRRSHDFRLNALPCHWAPSRHPHCTAANMPDMTQCPARAGHFGRPEQGTHSPHRGRNRTFRDSMSVPQLVFLLRPAIAGNAAIFSPRWTMKAS